MFKLPSPIRDRFSALLLLSCWLTTPWLLAQAPSLTKQEVQKQITDHWMQVSRDHAKTISIAPIETPNAKYRLHEHPVFQHIQLIRGNDVGAVHLWIDAQDRPAAIATIFAWTTSNTTRMLFNEFHSLADNPTTATQAGGLLWNSETAGTQWAAVPNAPTPHSNARRRQLQAKQLAKQFTSHMIDPKRKRWELRRIPTPVYEYEVKGDSQRSGALFVFCRATDIETILLLEARKTNEKVGLQWEYTCAKFTDYEPHMIHAGKEMWKPFEDGYLRNGDPHFWAPIGTREMPQVEKDFRG